MGKPLNPYVTGAFFDEMGLIKEAISPSSVRRLGAIARIPGSSLKSGRTLRETGGELLHRIRHPIQGLWKGWQEMAPRTNKYGLQNIAGSMAAVKETGKKTPWWKLPFLRAQSATHLVDPGSVKTLPAAVKGGAKGLQYRPVAPRNVSLLDIMRGTAPGVPSNRAQALAEELSRRGWTGTTQASKYLPVGEKGMFAGFTGAMLPAAMEGPEATRTGKGGPASRALGEAGGAAGWLLGTGLGAPGMAMWYGANEGGKYVGNVLDRMKSGAKFWDAVRAPSPEEAQQQIANISKYYGR